MPMYRLHVEAVYSFDFPVEAENEEAAKKLFDDMSEEDLFASSTSVKGQMNMT
jgi:hypothetical protein